MAKLVSGNPKRVQFSLESLAADQTLETGRMVSPDEIVNEGVYAIFEVSVARHVPKNVSDVTWYSDFNFGGRILGKYIKDLEGDLLISRVSLPQNLKALTAQSSSQFKP